MQKRTTLQIDMFLASSEETKDIRDKIVLEAIALNETYTRRNIVFNVVRWEEQSGAIPKSWRSQDEYNKILKPCDMCAVIIKNKLGIYTKEEFEKAVKFLQESGKPKVVVYTLPTNATDDERYKFIKSLREKENEGTDEEKQKLYFHEQPENADQLIHKISHELSRIADELEEERQKAVQGVSETIERMSPSKFTAEARELFEKGDYNAANESLDINKLSEMAQKAKQEQKEIAEAFVLKAKLVLTGVKDGGRFDAAKALFEEAQGLCSDPKILFEYAYYLAEQNEFKAAIAKYETVLKALRELAEKNPAVYLPDVATILNNLAVLHYYNNRHQEAEGEYTEALEIHSKLAEENPAVYLP
ncbi:MAG: tetratricopeptide repeat protein, partial [Oscillospiraceae bacterium]|nr:tetratricopeptide repeat protein [Oscillospiraceae bacterium]